MRAADPLVGRDAEEALLDGLLAGIADGGAAVLVRGGPGVGKSALVGGAAARAAGRGATVLWTSGVESESRLPYAGLLQLLEPLLAQATDLPDPQREALLGAVGQAPAAATDELGVAVGTLTLLRGAAADAPLVVVADDVHWLDRPTVAVLTFVARRIAADPVVVLATTRDGTPAALSDAHVEEVELAGLDPAAAALLVDARAPELPPHLRRRLLAEAEGNPLALVELSIAWRRRPPEGPPDGPVPVTTRLAETFAARMHTLDPVCRRRLLITAVNDVDSLTELLAAAADVEGAAVTPDDLRPAVDALLVEVDERGLHFRHPLVRSVVHEAAGADERRAAHAALARVLTDPDRVAWHRAAAIVVPDEDVAADLEAAASRACGRGATAVAVAALERAAHLSPEPRVRGRRLVRAADLAAELGRGDIVQRVLDDAERLPLDPVDRVRAEWRRSAVGEGVWRDVADVGALVDITERMGRLGDVDTALDALLAVATATWWTGADGERRRLVVEAAERLPVAADDPRLLAVLALSAPIERGATVLARLADIRPGAVDEPGAVTLLGTCAGAVGAQDLCAALLDRSVRRLRDEGRLGALANALVSQAWATWHLGRWDVAEAAAQESCRIGEQAGQPVGVACARLVEGALAAVRGEPARAEAIAGEVEDQFLPVGAPTVLALSTFVRGLAALADGRPDEAYDRLHALLAPSGAARGGASSWLDDDSAVAAVATAAIAAYADAAVQSSHVAEARAVLAVVDARARRCGSPLMRASVAYATPLLAEDDDEAEAAFRAALDAGVARWPFLHARLLLAWGGWLRRHRRVSESRPPLRAARDACDALAARAWSERARQELRATGEASPRRVRGVVEELTAQEAEIARLAARGLTNREIGQRLFLSHRTVGSHLYRVFPKLGITSRSELARALGVDP